MRNVEELREAERVHEPLIREDVHRHRVLPLEADDVSERDGERDAGHIELVHETGVVRQAGQVPIGGTIEGVLAGE